MSLKLQGIFFAALLASCSSSPAIGSDGELDAMSWLIGEWVADDGGNLTTESWRAVSPLTLEGVGEVRSRDTGELRSRETLRLVVMSDETFFVAKVGHNELPVAFKMTASSQNSAVFENPNHDFPKKLEYRLVSEDELTVTVSDGAAEGFRVSFSKRGEG